jgi:hypothetical protein
MTGGPISCLPPTSIQDLADFTDDIAAYHSRQTPIAADAAARKRLRKQQQQVHERDASTALANGSALPSPTGPTANADADAGGQGSKERGHGSRKWESTPEFVCVGELHPYQLEGLNWLYHKAQVRMYSWIICR